MKRYNELDLMKGIGIILVYLGHSFNLKGLERLFLFSYIHNIIYSFHMPLFFLISGFFINKAKIKKWNDKLYYINKINRLLIPYFFINLVDFVSRTLFPNLVNSKFGGIKEILFYGTKISWFIYTLFVIFMIFPFLEKYILSKDKYYLFGLFLFFINYFKVFSNIEIFSLNLVVIYMFYFYIGYSIHSIYDTKLKKILENNILFLGLSIIFLCFSYKYYMINFFTKILFALLGILVIFYISQKIKKEGIVYEILKFYGVNSLAVYLIEGFITVIYRVILFKIISIEEEELFVTLFFILRLVTAFIVIKIITKNSILSFLLGAQKEK